MRVTIDVPDFDAMSDEQIADVVRLRDGKWSPSTKALLAQFQTARLDLNSGWGWTPSFWSCPCCKREKPQIARLSLGGVLLCRLEIHHDHLRDRAKAIFAKHNPRTEDKDQNWQTIRAKDLVLNLTERFEPSLICIDCNLAEGKAKLMLKERIAEDFSFSTAEIASFIKVTSNKLHEIDLDLALTAWEAAKEDMEARLVFAETMAKRVAEGRHRKAFGQFRDFGPIQDRDFIYGLFLDACPKGLGIGATIDTRSLSYASAGHSPKPKAKAKSRPPTDAEYRELDQKLQVHKPWMEAGADWKCPSCDRSKFETCRKSNAGKWTSHVHRFYVFPEERNTESLWRRRMTARVPIILSSRDRVLVCHDCRSIASETMRRLHGLSEYNFTLDDFRELIVESAPHAAHKVDFDRAIESALSNQARVTAIGDLDDHYSQVGETLAEVKDFAKFMTWTEAKRVVGYEFHKATDHDWDDSVVHIEWLIDEAKRLGVKA